MLQFLQLLKQKTWAKVFVIYLRYLIGGAFVFASVVKIQGQRFTAASGEHEPINSAWHFFETMYRSGLYWQFLGWGQLLAALVLMTQRFATLGAMLFLPITLNIFVITLSYYFAGTPLITGLMLLANIFLLAWDYPRLHLLLRPESRRHITLRSSYDTYLHHTFWTWLGLLLFVTTTVYLIIYGRNPVAWFFLCVLEGLAGFVYFTIRHRKRNSGT